MIEKGAWSARAVPGAEFLLWVVPRARHSGIEEVDGVIRCAVREPPEDGRATAAVQVLLAQALGVAKTRLVLRRGATTREKLFRLE